MSLALRGKIMLTADNRHDTVSKNMRVPYKSFEETYPQEVMALFQLFQTYYKNLRSILHPSMAPSAPAGVDDTPKLTLNEANFPIFDPTCDFTTMTHKSLSEYLTTYAREHWRKEFIYQSNSMIHPSFQVWQVVVKHRGRHGRL